jgi:Lrp/AsnC family transcriptional regulator for asnA, asnC and gidA
MNNNGDDKNKLDPLDCKMIGLLQQDGRMSNTAMAQALGISEYTVRTRLKRIIESGIIRIVARANPIDLGFAFSGNLKIHIDLKMTRHVLDKLSEIDDLTWVALTTGSTDLDVDFAVRSMNELKTLIFDKISNIEGVLSTETSLMVDLIKDKNDYGTAWD